jgi:hypothetical protein
MSALGESSPLLGGQEGGGRGRVEGRSSTHEANALVYDGVRKRVGVLYLCLMLFYLYLLYVMPARAPPSAPPPSPAPPPAVVNISSSAAPSGMPSSPSFRPSDTSPTSEPSAVEMPVVPVPVPVMPVPAVPVPLTSMTCRNNETFQESASALVYPSFAACGVAVRGSIELLKNALGTYSFAYFPLQAGKVLSYVTWTVENMDMVEFPPWPVAKTVRTADPIEALIYYTNSIYTAIGDLADSQTGADLAKISRMQALVGNLTESWNRTISEDILPGLSWDSYLQHPGPRGRAWPDGTNVTWAAGDKKYADASSALYLGQSGRIVDDQLWGDAKPVQGSSVMAAIRQLITRQVDETMLRYKKLRELDTSGNGNWATQQILTSNNGILTYHRVRKVLRMIGLTIDAFPEVISAFYDKIPASVLKFVNKHYDAELHAKTEMSYGDIFCYKSLSSNVYAFSAGNYKCTKPVTSIGTMIFANLSAFDSEFFDIDQSALDTLRVVLMIKAFRLGNLEVLSNTSSCPSFHPSYIRMNSDSSTDPFTPADGWTRPTLQQNGYGIVGTICELDDYFGDLHDLLVRIQQNVTTSNNANFVHYTVSVAQGLQLFLETIDVKRVLELNLLNGLCQDAKVNTTTTTTTTTYSA